MPLKQKKEQRKKVCIFCGEGRLSKEHIWPQRWHSIMPRLPNALKRQTSTNYAQDEHSKLWKRTSKPTSYRQGACATITTRTICIDCNGTWIAKIQDRATPAMTEVILGKNYNLDLISQQYIAAWAALFTCSIDSIGDEGLSISGEDRRYLKDNLSAPPNWIIGLGRFDGSWEWSTVYRQSKLQVAEVGSEADLHKHNCQTSTFTAGLGVFFVHSKLESCPTIIKDSDRFFSQRSLNSIQPCKKLSVQAPRSFYSNTDCDALSLSLYDILSSIVLDGSVPPFREPVELGINPNRKS